MRVIYSIGTTFAGGGIGSIAYHAVRGIHRHGQLQRLLCDSYRPNSIPSQRIRALGLPGRALRRLAVNDASGRLWYLQSLLYDAWAARQLEPADLLHVWVNYGYRTLRRARELGMYTVVDRASSHPLHQAQLLREEYTRWGGGIRLLDLAIYRAAAEIEAADAIVIPSDFVRDSFRRLGFPDSRLIQAPFGVDSARFRPADLPAARPFRALFVGQIGLRKGVPYLLEAWRQLGWRDAELWLVGGIEAAFAPLLERWRGLPGLQITGHVADPVQLFQQADVFVFPSIEEGSALVTYEAMACGLPLITSHHSGSVARDGEEGFLIPIRDVDALAARLEQLRSDDVLRCRMSQAARQRAEAFSWERYGDALAEAYTYV